MAKKTDHSPDTATQNETLEQQVTEGAETVNETGETPKEETQGGENPAGSVSTPDTATQNVNAGKTVRIQNENLKNGKIFLANGQIAVFDPDGIAEIDSSQSDRLLSIPCYKKI